VNFSLVSSILRPNERRRRERDGEERERREAQREKRERKERREREKGEKPEREREDREERERVREWKEGDLREIISLSLSLSFFLSVRPLLSLSRLPRTRSQPSSSSPTSATRRGSSTSSAPWLAAPVPLETRPRPPTFTSNHFCHPQIHFWSLTKSTFDQQSVHFDHWQSYFWLTPRFIFSRWHHFWSLTSSSLTNTKIVFDHRHITFDRWQSLLSSSSLIIDLTFDHRPLPPFCLLKAWVSHFSALPLCCLSNFVPPKRH